MNQLNKNIDNYLKAINQLRYELTQFEQTAHKLEQEINTTDDIETFVDAIIDELEKYPTLQKYFNTLHDDIINNRYYVPLAGNSGKVVPFGSLMKCPDDPVRHPHVVFYRKGQVCRICGTELVKK